MNKFKFLILEILNSLRCKKWPEIKKYNRMIKYKNDCIQKIIKSRKLNKKKKKCINWKLIKKNVIMNKADLFPWSIVDVEPLNGESIWWWREL